MRARGHGVRRSLAVAFAFAAPALSVHASEDPQAAGDERPQPALTPPQRYAPGTGQPIPVEDRWRVDLGEYRRYPGDASGEYPFSETSLWDPFNLNVLKGDYPIVGQNTFFVLTLVSDSTFEARRLPTPSGVSTARPGSEEFFGDPDQTFFNQNFITTFEVFHGETAYKPRDWEFRFTPVFNYNQLNTMENTVVHVDARRGTDRKDGFIGVQELFLEVHLKDVSPYYDFYSVRAGVQQFTSDFRGFIFVDNEPGVRLFGTLGSNRDQWNLAWFSNVEKDTNSGLNDISNGREQNVFIANYYRQDFVWLGYTAQLSAHYNRDHGNEQFDENEFLARPSNIGDVDPHDVDAVYLGWAGDGHIGRLNLSHAVFQVLGRDSNNPLAGRDVDISAQMAALEVSCDFDWLRPKASIFYSSGDADPEDGEATAFCPILDAPNFAGGPNSFWNRQGIKLTQTGVNLVDRLSLVPHLRSSKIQDQANFVNPGILLFNAGLTAKLTPKLKADFNVNWSRFVFTEPLELVLNQNDIDKAIGWDVSLGVEYRPLLTDNVILASGVAGFFPRAGFRDIFTSQTLFQAFLMVTLTY
jgi:hypothetical protein